MSIAVLMLFIVATLGASLGIVSLMAAGTSSAITFICLILLLLVVMYGGGQKAST